MSGEKQFVRHPIPPTFDEQSRILILGSFPSVKSREMSYFYGHPQNRFWRVMAQLFASPFPETIDARKALLLSHGIALWDVIASCEIRGSSDTSIENAEPTDLRMILSHSAVSKIFTNGKKAEALYQKFQRAKTGIDSVCLPSTSPANASWSLERLVSAWHVILDTTA